MQCLQCQHHNPEGAKFCNACAAPVVPVCPACTTENPPGATFCHQCATNLQTLPSAISTVHKAASESRFQALLRAVMGLLCREKRVTYRTLQYTLSLDDRLVAEIRDELLFTGIAIDVENKGLV